MADENKDLAATDKIVADALERLNDLSAVEIDQKIQTIKTFVEETTEALTQQASDIKRKYDRQIALLEAARATLKA